MQMKSRKKRNIPKNALYKNVVNLWEAIPRTAETPPAVQADLPRQEDDTPPKHEL